MLPLHTLARILHHGVGNLIGSAADRFEQAAAAHHRLQGKCRKILLGEKRLHSAQAKIELIPQLGKTGQLIPRMPERFFGEFMAATE
ncbi:MAG: hypothetical protein BWY83_01778 [bacterium ADurb.Bin478]|nr:MAG: hypothetical protein BWY83_01778 [bacterium ADurb.Bin478]